MKQASIYRPADEYEDDIDLSYLESMVLSIMRPTRGPHDPSMVNYNRGGSSISTLRLVKIPDTLSAASLEMFAFGFLTKLIGMNPSS
jgi:hypothetical protein